MPSCIFSLEDLVSSTCSSREQISNCWFCLPSLLPRLFSPVPCSATSSFSLLFWYMACLCASDRAEKACIWYEMSILFSWKRIFLSISSRRVFISRFFACMMRACSSRFSSAVSSIPCTAAFKSTFSCWICLCLRSRSSSFLTISSLALISKAYLSLVASSSKSIESSSAKFFSLSFSRLCSFVKISSSHSWISCVSRSLRWTESVNSS
mmetsp:Transcript_15293/g.33760  ORF Transcript_15293/g.33760 Transcript_15293/m.33760 type:complete len:209 (+) Transcript_15293:3947-4573(+)